MKSTLIAVMLLSCVTFSIAQTAAAAKSPAEGSTKDPVASSLRMLLPRSEKNVVGAVEAMPADKYSYKPTPEQNTFGHLVTHIIEFNNSLCAKAADVPAPKVEEVKETDPKDKLVAAVKASYAFCNEALSKMDDSKLGDSIELFGGHQGPRAMAALIVASGWSDHYATAAMYLRLNGIVPPSAQQKH